MCVRGRAQMAGYWNEPELTARTLRDGRVHTGDIGHLDEAGLLHLHGRIADVIKVKGIKVHPSAVERVRLLDIRAWRRPLSSGSRTSSASSGSALSWCRAKV